MMERIILLTGLKRSGKTTALQKWIAGQQRLGGVLTPDLHGIRHFLHIPPRQYIPMECEPGTAETIRIGNFLFSRESFRMANDWIRLDFDNPQISCVLIDEIGPLEVQGEGLSEALNYVLDRLPGSGKTLLLVVREKLVGQVIRHWALSDVRVILKESLDQIMEC